MKSSRFNSEQLKQENIEKAKHFLQQQSEQQADAGPGLILVCATSQHVSASSAKIRQRSMKMDRFKPWLLETMLLCRDSSNQIHPEQTFC